MSENMKLPTSQSACEVLTVSFDVSRFSTEQGVQAPQRVSFKHDAPTDITPNPISSEVQTAAPMNDIQDHKDNIVPESGRSEPPATKEPARFKFNKLDLASYLWPVRETEAHLTYKLIPSTVPGFERPEYDITTSPTNIYVLRRFHKKEDGTRGDFSRYLPNFPYLDYATSVQLPQYLYRATHDASGGHSSKGHFKSKAMVNGLGATDFFSFNNHAMREMIERHENGSWFKDDHWISFTDSMATVVGRALKYEREGKTNVQVHVVDTYTILKPTMIVWAYGIMKAYKACENYHDPLQTPHWSRHS